ncbi:hypothetical protein GCM10010193_42660 [Kitasatospora atroaurantiaca]|uniref:Uncharacterized protein n=1 Tax=Kitasatospora atroaurantiaca TaxID=285545 RepID=A0A561ETX1_9ACTN|nr:hypothetical protein [Kitasatospora atroaurantiaca]TWE19063.1 hypothetical protein FB465_4165 [Kitasatospora atroaurantiaca]
MFTTTPDHLGATLIFNADAARSLGSAPANPCDRGLRGGSHVETQVDIRLNATASCINPGQHHPKADNKQSVSQTGTCPVQNGQAQFTLTVTATFKPQCSPPMTVVFSHITLADVAHNVSANVPGTF